MAKKRKKTLHDAEWITHGFYIAVVFAFVFAGLMYGLQDVFTDDGTITPSLQTNIIQNEPPVADAGPDQNSEVTDEVTLDGSASFDPDGAITSYKWTQSESNPESHTLEEQQTVALNLNTIGTYSFTLTVRDTDNEESQDSLFITVVEPPLPPSIPEDTEKKITITNEDGNTEIIKGQRVILDANENGDTFFVSGPSAITLENGSENWIKSFTADNPGAYTVIVTSNEPGSQRIEQEFRVYDFGACLPSIAPCDLKTISEAIEAFGTSYN